MHRGYPATRWHARRYPSAGCGTAGQSTNPSDGLSRPGCAPPGSGSPARTAHTGAAAAPCPRAGSHRQGCRTPGWPGTAARSATPAAARARARRRPGSGGIVPSPTRYPKPVSSPWMRQYPQRGVLPCQLFDESTYLVRDRRPSRRARVGPFLPGQATVPGQHGARGHDPVQPQAPGQQPGQGGDHGTVSPVRPRARNLPPQDRYLMPQHQDLRVLSGVTPRQEHQPAEHADNEQVDEADEHERRA
jgi:hypothetical protein